MRGSSRGAVVASRGGFFLQERGSRGRGFVDHCRGAEGGKAGSGRGGRVRLAEPVATTDSDLCWVFGIAVGPSGTDTNLAGSVAIFGAGREVEGIWSVPAGLGSPGGSPIGPGSFLR